MKTGVYIHIPFCIQKCLYCDFLSFPSSDAYFEAYKNALIAEIENCSELEETLIETIFFGGGTPTILNASFIVEILDAIYSKNVSEKAEITIEANPGTIDISYLVLLKNKGVNRLSLGLQTSKDYLLKKIGRLHNKEQFFYAYKNAIEAGFKNINIDIMFSLPSQTVKDWKETLDYVIELKPAHISVYSLIIEEDTVFGELFKNGKLIVNDEETDREMYHMAKMKLEVAGYEQYEISNFYLKEGGEPSKHNIIYWERENYLGFGLNAHSFFCNERYNNTEDLEEYLNNNGKVMKKNRFEVSLQNSMEEFMFLGLRMTNGISVDKFKLCFGKDIFYVYGTVIDKYIKSKHLSLEGGRLSLTKNGIDVSNVVLSDFIF